MPGVLGVGALIRDVRPYSERMQMFRVMVHGENLLTEADGTPQRFGFYTHVVVEAFTAVMPSCVPSTPLGRTLAFRTWY